MEESDILRVISGTARGHKLKTLKGSNTRPTSDRVKESLFNIISGYIIDADVLDLFAGTGNLGIEALSRGAGSAVFVDKSRECCEIIKDNLAHTKLSDKAAVIPGDIKAEIEKLYKEGKKFDIIFLDPPYNKNFVTETLYYLAKNDIIKFNGILVGERDYIDEVPEEVGIFRLIRNERYGDTVLSFYKPHTGQ